MVKQDRNHRAFLLADAMIGIAILATLLGIFAGAMGKSNAITNKLADARAAWRRAEGALADAQAGRETKLAEIRPVTGGDTPVGFIWVEAVAKEDGQEARLVGLIPKSRGGGQ